MTCASLVNVLLPALAPCRHLEGACRNFAAWNPACGDMPRGFGGANGCCEAVRLVLVTAEPGSPGDSESYGGAPAAMLTDHLRFFEHTLRHDALRRAGRGAPFHRNLRVILDLCWPVMSLDQQLAVSWITNAVKCTPSRGKIGNASSTCVSSYAAREIGALPHAYVIALGHAANRRLKAAGVRVDQFGQHPSARPNTNPRRSWKIAASEFRRWLRAHPLPG